MFNSKAIHYGLNQDYEAYADDRYVRCNNCNFICHLDRDITAPDGSHVGEGNIRPNTQLNGAVLADATTITVDSTAGFTTPSTGSITAIADVNGKRIRITSASHGLKGGIVTISSTTNHDGDFHIQEFATDTFDILGTFVATDTGTWTIKEHFYIYDAGTYATDGDVASTYTDATNAPKSDKVTYTGLSSTTFTGCIGATAHDDNMYVRGDVRAGSGCPQCGKLNYAG